MKSIISLLSISLLLVSCHTTWVLIDADNKNLSLGPLSFKAPIGWLTYKDINNRYGDAVLTRSLRDGIQRIQLSKDGLELNTIDVIRLNIDQAFPSIHQGANLGLLPSELAERYVAEQKILTGVDIFTVTRNEPTTIVRHSGFLLQYHFRSSTGLNIERITYGFITNNYFYTIAFRAPSLHFFDASIHDFTDMLNSLRLHE